MAQGKQNSQYPRTALTCESLYCLRTPIASKCPSSITALYHLYNCQLKTVASFEPAFVETLFYQAFNP